VPESFALLRDAVRALKEDQPVGMPTETVYGLAANCLKISVIKGIFFVDCVNY
jgi:tRNA A37 threonylcarbamoyladenosine synthetase subunit TsaC/SUA5/YrdC